MNTIQTPLFGEILIETETPHRRAKAMQKILDAQSQAFKSAYREFAVGLMKDGVPRLSEDIRFEYLKTCLPKPHSKNKSDAWKATGGIIHKLLKDGLLQYHCIDGVRQYKWTRGAERQMPLLIRGKYEPIS